MPANAIEEIIGFGKNKQTNLTTPNTAAGLMRMGNLIASTAYPKLNTENDAAEYGKGHEFAEQVFKTYWDVNFQIQKYMSAEWAAWAMAFGLGHVAKSGASPNFTYTCSPLDKVSDGLELPCFSFVEQVRPGTGAVYDYMNIGCAIEGWTVTLASGPGRASSRLDVDIIGTGNFLEPSGITLPARTAEKLLPAAKAQITINGTDYVAAKNFVALTAGWRNNHLLDDGFFPGSGVQDDNDPNSGAVRGRLEVGTREATLQFTVRFEHGSTEYQKLKEQTEGTAVISIPFDANNSLQLTYHRCAFSAVDKGDQNGIITVQVTATPLMDASNGLLTAVCKCGIDGIAEVE